MLSSSALLIVTGEDPFDALAAHPDEPEKQPTHQENGQEVTDQGNGGKILAREIVWQLHDSETNRQPEDEHEEQQS
jgi:hypothetical protein